MQKRGQVTIFIAIGIILVVIVAATYFFYFRGVSFTKPSSFAADNVDSYIHGCLDESIGTAVGFCAGNFYDGTPKCDPYDEELENKIIIDFVDCIDFSAFPNLDIKSGNVEDVKVIEKSDVISVEIVYPVNIKRGVDEHNLKKFYSEHELVASACASVDVDSNCILQSGGPVDVTILDLTFTYNNGDYVGMSPNCFAC